MSDKSPVGFVAFFVMIVISLMISNCESREMRLRKSLEENPVPIIEMEDVLKPIDS